MGIGFTCMGYHLNEMGSGLNETGSDLNEMGGYLSCTWSDFGVMERGGNGYEGNYSYKYLHDWKYYVVEW